MKRYLGLLAVLVFLCLGLNSSKETFADDVIYIFDAEDMELLHTNPTGAFKLVNDIDMKGISWTPQAFAGTLDGNGFAILNLSINETGSNIRQTYDGNMKVYDTRFAGLFDVVENATISNLSVLGLNINIETTGDCFVGGLAGYAGATVIDNCYVEGNASVSTDANMFGIGGIVGYGGASTINNSIADMTLISIDRNAEVKDEQFLGGAYAAGYIDLISNTILIRGYISEHGYVHSGGLLGMYVFFPAGVDFYGTMTGNNVQGFIRFFEDNTDRRAYCEQFWGELMNWNFLNDGNVANFTRDEVTDFSKNLLPHDCSDVEYIKKEVKPENCGDYVFTHNTCNVCEAYFTRTDYKLPVHNYGYEHVISEPTENEYGIKDMVCDTCGKEVFIKLRMDETETSTTEEESSGESESESQPQETVKPTEESKEQVETTSVENKEETTAAAPTVQNITEGESSSSGVNPMVIFVIIVLIIAIGLTVWVFIGL